MNAPGKSRNPDAMYLRYYAAGNADGGVDWREILSIVWYRIEISLDARCDCGGSILWVFAAVYQSECVTDWECGISNFCEYRVVIE